MAYQLSAYVVHKSEFSDEVSSVTSQHCQWFVTIIMQCERNEVIKLAFEDIMDRPYQAVVGTGCSKTITAINAILHFWNISQVINNFNILQ